MCMLDTVRAKRDDVYAIARKHKIGKVYVFGSCARREETPDSDVDFLVEFDEGASLLDQVHARDDLRDVFHRDVDVVSSRGLSPYIGPQILAEAVAI